MTSNETGNHLAELEDALSRNALNEAISILKDVADGCTDWESINRLNEIADSYKYLCRYFLDGSPDPSRTRMLADMKEGLRCVRDRLERKSRENNSGAYYAALRLSRLRNYNLPQLLTGYRALMSQISLAGSVGDVPADLASRRYDMLDEIFTSELVSFQNSKDTKSAEDAILDTDSDKSLRVQLLSAVILSLLAWYDADKMMLLVNVAGNADTDTDTRMRALTGIIFALMAHGSRIAQNERLCSNCATVVSTDEMAGACHSVIKAIAGTRDTERVADKVTKEVIPEIMKLHPDILNKMKDFNPEDPESMENNPEWQEMLEKSGIADKLKELSEMQNDGADLMMVTFSQLKKFPFFRNINNWFLPFDSHNPNLKLTPAESQLLDNITGIAPFICDSDKYSLAIGLSQTPESQRQMLSMQFDQQFRQMSEEMMSTATGPRNKDMSIILSTRDFYRYLMLGRDTGDFTNPFKIPLDFVNLPIIGESLDDVDFLQIMAEFYMRRDFFAEALSLFSKIEKHNGADSSMWQKIGFCRQKLHDFEGAREAYMKAELLGDDSEWTTRKLAFVNRRLGDYTSALEYYTKLLDRKPDDVQLLVNAARMSSECGNHDLSLSHYYHADYLSPADAGIQRSLAWEELLAGNSSKAENLYSALLLDTPTASDWLNAGHVAQVRGQYRTALERYRRAAAPGAADFMLIYNADIPVLEHLGANREAIMLLLDIVMNDSGSI